MLVLRQVVFPALRLLVWAVIAIALSVLAFGGGSAQDAGPLHPSADLAGGTVLVEEQDLTSTIDVTGTVTADPAVTERSTANGTVSAVHVKPGTVVEVGTRLIDVTVPLEPVEGTVVTAPDGTVTASPPRQRSKVVRVTATAAGTVTAVEVLVDQDVSVGTDVVTVSPGTLFVAAPLTQAEQFRLLAPPGSASAQAPGGPAPFECLDLTTSAAPAQEQNSPGYDPFTGMPTESATAQVTCRVPAGTTVFAGMSVDLTIDLGSVPGALTVPISAVLGTIGTGTVWVVGEDGEPVERAVTLGLSDGQAVQVVEGLTAGDEVLRFARVVPAAPDDADGEVTGT